MRIAQVSCVLIYEFQYILPDGFCLKCCFCCKIAVNDVKVDDEDDKIMKDNSEFRPIAQAFVHPFAKRTLHSFIHSFTRSLALWLAAVGFNALLRLQYGNQLGIVGGAARFPQRIQTDRQHELTLLIGCKASYLTSQLKLGGDEAEAANLFRLYRRQMLQNLFIPGSRLLAKTRYKAICFAVRQLQSNQ